MDKRARQIVLGLGIVVVVGAAFWLLPDDPKPQNVSTKEKEHQDLSSVNLPISDIIAQNQTAPKLEPDQPTAETESTPDNEQKQPQEEPVEEPVQKEESPQDEIQTVEEQPTQQTSQETESTLKEDPQPETTTEKPNSEEPQSKEQNSPDKENDAEIKALIDRIKKLEAEKEAMKPKQEKQSNESAKKEREAQQKELDLLKKQIAQLEKATTTKDEENKLLKEQLAKLEKLAEEKKPLQITNNQITVNIQPVDDITDESMLEEFLTDDESIDIVADLNSLEDGETMEITDEDYAITFVFTKVGDNIEVEQASDDDIEDDVDPIEDQKIEEDAVIHSENI